MSKRAAQSPIDSQRKTKKQKKEIETVPDEQAEFLEASILYIHSSNLNIYFFRTRRSVLSRASRIMAVSNLFNFLVLSISDRI